LVSSTRVQLLYIFLLLYGCTVVQDQCTIVALYYCITSLPVYPHTVHGHCTTVVLDTSNRVYCIATLMDAKYSLCPIILIPLDPSIRKTSGILPKRHSICIELD
jgi:hypothetical protein